jgi:phosphoribosylformimino-5-aminoimidazole carboxamide ribotide isomerase
VRVIGVLDLFAGRAVHARAGDRASYRPVQDVAASSIEPGDALALAHTYIDRLGLSELYVADLDAILHGTPQQALVAALTALGVPVWLDAGISSVDQARLAIDVGAAHVIVGLETLSSFAALAEICSALGRQRVAFSLDLRDGQPVGPAAADLPAPLIAARAADAGAGAVIVIDLARVGTGSGSDFETIERIRSAAPELMLLAGGGVRSLDDLVRLAESGCDGALVATALLNGSLGFAELAMAKQWACHR